MNKGAVVAGVVVLAGVAYVGSSWYVGQQAEASIRAAIEQTNQEFTMLGGDLTSRGMELSIKEYKRGIFSADAVYALTLNNMEDGPVELTMADHLQHGPFPLDTLKAGDFTPLLAYSQVQLLPAPEIQVWFDSQQAKSPLLATTRIGMGGKGNSVLTFAPVDYSKDAMKLTFSGGQMNIDFDQDFKNSESTGRFDSLHVVNGDDDINMELSGLTINSNAKTTGDQSTINSEARFDKLSVTDDDEGIVAEAVTVAMASQQIGKLLDGSVHYQLGRMTTGKADLGQLDITVDVKKLDMEALTDLANTYDKIETERQASDDSLGLLTTEQEALLQEKMFALLASQPSVSVQPIVWKNAAGESTASLQLDLAAPVDVKAVQDDPITALNQILKRLQLDVNVSRAMFIETFGQVARQEMGDMDADQAAEISAEVYDQAVNQYASKGLVTATEDGAALALGFQDGKITLNGQEIPTQQLMMLMLMAM